MTNLLRYNLASPKLNTRTTLIGNMTKPNSGRNGKPLPESALLDEAVEVMHGGVLDISNILPYGTFHLARDPKAQQKLHEELKGVWENPADPIPHYESLRHLPYLVCTRALEIKLSQGKSLNLDVERCSERKRSLDTRCHLRYAPSGHGQRCQY